uniref:Uncharacterized protein n=1 Tax=Glossina palpalis gambiensis TaxID=67801 RepID=A0A1B0ATQ5_9MUSC
MHSDWDMVRLSKQNLEGSPNQVTAIVVRVENDNFPHVCAKHKANVFYFIYPPEIASNGDDVGGGNGDDVMPFSYCALPQLFICKLCKCLSCNPAFHRITIATNCTAYANFDIMA